MDDINGKRKQYVFISTKPQNIKNLYPAGQRLTVPGALPVAAEKCKHTFNYQN
jgi:hypothetical protein